jgi:hypothetical protein
LSWRITTTFYNIGSPNRKIEKGRLPTPIKCRCKLSNNVAVDQDALRQWRKSHAAASERVYRPDSRSQIPFPHQSLVRWQSALCIHHNTRVQDPHKTSFLALVQRGVGAVGLPETHRTLLQDRRHNRTFVGRCSTTHGKTGGQVVIRCLPVLPAVS